MVITEKWGPMEVVGQAFLEEVSLYFTHSKIRRLRRGVLGCPKSHLLQRDTLALDATFRLGRRSFQSSRLRGHSLSKPNPWGHKFTHPEMSMTSKCLSHYIYILHVVHFTSCSTDLQ